MVSAKTIPEETLDNFWIQEQLKSLRRRDKGRHYALERYIYNFSVELNDNKLLLEAPILRSQSKREKQG